MKTNLTNDQLAYLAAQMNKVSRSFALVAPAVETPLNNYLATAYLICRVIDNIEDCTRPYSWQKERFTEFDYLLKNPAAAPDVLAQWEQEAWPGLSTNEARMMTVSDGLPLWQIYGQIPEAFQSAIARWALEMVHGMEKILNPAENNMFVSRQGVQLPATEAGYDLYCYYVAGTVGHMITDLAILHYDLPEDVAARLDKNSQSSGRALQKTNIVKDFAEDLKRDVCYLPDEWLREVDYLPLSLRGAPLDWKYMVVANVLNELEDSVNYILDLPYTAVGYRQASLLMLLPAYQTLLQAAQNHTSLFTPDHNVKISRQTMAQCLIDAQTLVSDNDALQTYSQAMHAQLDKAFESDRITTTTQADY
ncbi:MAG TPA: hypothetical protein EYP41_22355 [Anaerolineae bacterium]|nr:hypothetical protein [Anaerolineae bacterium]